MNLGDIASIATLVLFLFYFAGRAWAIEKEKTLMRESFALKQTELDGFIPDDCEIYYALEDGPYGEIIEISSEVPILWFHVIPIKYDSSFADITPKNTKPVVTHTSPIRANFPIYLKTDIPDGFPTYKICFLRYDYMKVTFNISYNGKCGGMTPTDYKISPTFRGLLYYLLK